MKKLFIGVIIIATIGCMSSCGSKNQNKQETSDSTQVSSNGYPANSPVAKYGALQVKGTQLCDKEGNPVQLVGMSTMGWQWCEDCYTKESLENLVNNWHINVLRLAMYVEEGGYNKDPEHSREFICRLIDQCGELGIYAVIDWHILTPGNPLAPEYAGAADFFRFISSKYAGKDHVIYEICNEPNNCQRKNNPEKPWECTREENVTWETITQYANKIIPIIHAAADSVKASHPIVIVGTPQWCQLVDACLKDGRFQGNDKDFSDPLPDKDTRLKYDNIMYSFHFYAAEHNEGFRKGSKMYYYNMYAYMDKVLAELPVFCSEFGVSEASGDGKMDFGRTDSWLFLFNGHNSGQQKVSFINWSYSDKKETTAALKDSACVKKEWDDVSFSGDYMKRVITMMNTGVADPQVLRPENLANLERYKILNW